MPAGPLRTVAVGATLAIAVAAVAIAGYVAGASGAEDQDEAGPTAAPVDEVTPQLERYVERAMAERDVPAVAVGIVADGELAYARGFGSGADGRPVDADTLFEIGSATKSFLGATLALAVDRGQLAWDDRVIDHHPGFGLADAWATREFRVFDLLAQRTGLAPYSADVLSLLGYAPAASIAALKQIPAVSSFRSEFAYQNVPHLVASEIVAEKAGAENWNDAVAELLLGPLGMSASGTSAETLTASDNSTRGHQLRDGSLREVAPVSLPEKVYGAGAIVSNVSDMARWVQFQLGRGELEGKRILSAEAHAETWRPRVAVEGEFAERMEQVPGATELAYATGWLVHSVPEGRIVEHGGTTLGYTSAVRLDPDRQVGVVVLTNQSHAGGIASAVSRYAFDLLQGREPHDVLAGTEPAAPNAPDPDPDLDLPALRAELAGSYRHPVAGTLDVEAAGDELAVAVGPLRETARLEPVDRATAVLSWHVDDREDGPLMSAPVAIVRDKRQGLKLVVADIEFERR